MEVVSGVRIVQCHAIIDVVIDVRVMQCHAIIDVVIGVRVVLCHQAINNSGFSTFLNFPLRVQILILSSSCINSSSLFPVAILCTLLHSGNTSFEVWYLQTQSNTSPNSLMQQNERKASRTRSLRGNSPSGRMSRWTCKDYLKRTCNNSFCEKWHPPECLFYKTKSGCRFGEKCSYAHRQVDEQPTKRSKKNDDKSAVAM